MTNTYRLWNEDGFNYMFDTDADRDEVEEVIAYVVEHIEEYDNEDVTTRLEVLGFKVNVHDVPEENTFYWG